MMTPEVIARATRLVAGFEGCRLAPYRDAVGIWTIGYGNTTCGGTRVTASTATLSQAEAELLLGATVASVAARVDGMVPAGTTDDQRVALISLAFNIGTGALYNSTLLHRLHSGDPDGAAQCFPSWVYAGGHVLPGLINRRRAERAVFCGEAA